MNIATTSVGMIKTVSSVVVATGVGAIVTNVVKATVPTDMTFNKKLSVGVGMVVLAPMIGEIAADYAKTQIDATVDFLKESKEGVLKIKSLFKKQD